MSKLDLRASMYTLLTLTVGRGGVNDLIRNVTHKINSNGRFFFKEVQIVLHLECYMASVDLTQLIESLNVLNLNVVALSGMIEREVATQLGMIVFAKKKNDGAKLSALLGDDGVISSMFHEGNVISGQIVDSQERDLIVLGSVSHGAILKSEGSVFVFGDLRGQVEAGIKGNYSSCVLATRMRAQKVSIADVAELGYRIELQNDKNVMLELVKGKIATKL